MPFINVKTSVEMSGEQAESLRAALTRAAEQCLGKPEAFVMCGFEDNCRLYFRNGGGIAYVEVKLFGKGSAGAYAKMTAQVSDAVSEVLGISSDKIYVNYQESSDWGWNGSNF